MALPEDPEDLSPGTAAVRPRLLVVNIPGVAALSAVVVLVSAVR